MILSYKLNKEQLRERLNLKSREFRFGSGRERENVVFMTVSTGIGFGIVINGRLIRGVTGTAGEIGHSIIQYDSDQMCTCGNYGCIMALSSGLFFPSLYRKKLEQGIDYLINDNNLQENYKHYFDASPANLILADV